MASLNVIRGRITAQISEQVRSIDVVEGRLATVNTVQQFSPRLIVFLA